MASSQNGDKATPAVTESKEIHYRFKNDKNCALYDVMELDELDQLKIVITRLKPSGTSFTSLHLLEF